MSEPVILFVKPKAISARDKKALSNAGVIVVEVDDPSAVKLTRAAAEISSTQMLALAARAIRSSSPYFQAKFANLVCDALMENEPAPLPSEPGQDEGASE